MLTTMLMKAMPGLAMFLPAGKTNVSHVAVTVSAAAVCLGLLVVRRRNRKESR